MFRSFRSLAAGSIVLIGALLVPDVQAQIRRIPPIEPPIPPFVPPGTAPITSPVVLPRTPVSPRLPATPVRNPVAPSQINEHLLLQLQLQRQALLLQRLAFMSAHQHRMLHAMNRRNVNANYGLGAYLAPYLLNGAYGNYPTMSYAATSSYAPPVVASYTQSRYTQEEIKEAERNYVVKAIEQKKTIEAMQLDRSLNNPLAGELQSGAALNVVLTDIRRLLAIVPAEQIPVQQLTLTDEMLERVNVTRGAGNVGILKREDKLEWPVAFKDLDDLRIRLTNRLSLALQQLETDGVIAADTLKLLIADVDVLHAELKRLAPNMSFEEHVEAKTFVKNVDEAVVALQQPDLQQYFTGVYVIKARTAYELVKQMTDNDLRFAAAIPGDENVYKTVHQALVAFHRSLQASADATSTKKAY